VKTTLNTVAKTTELVNPDDLVVIDNVSKIYPSNDGPVRALESVNLVVRRREFVSILGRSGCGKSTLLKMVAGLIPASTGEIHMAGRIVTEPVEDLGMVFQTPLLLAWRTVLSNIMLPVEIRKLPKQDGYEIARRLIKMVGLEGYENRFPSELSGGMQQRVSICRALICNPPLTRCPSSSSSSGARPRKPFFSSPTASRKRSCCQIV
jgi:NitT/TauT family transport system ATP-binding protein